MTGTHVRRSAFYTEPENCLLCPHTLCHYNSKDSIRRVASEFIVDVPMKIWCLVSEAAQTGTFYIYAL